MCCYYSEKAAKQVIDGMRMLARANREPPFACLSMALMKQDIEVKAAVMQFVNSMAIGVGDFNTHSLLRADLNTQLFGQRLDETIRSVDNEMKIFQSVSASHSIDNNSGIASSQESDSSSNSNAGGRLLGARRPSLKAHETRKKISLKSLVIFSGLKALDDKRKSEAELLPRNSSGIRVSKSDKNLGSKINSGNFVAGVNPMRETTAADLLEEDDIEIKPPVSGDHSAVGGRSTFVNPRKGTMAGLLTAVKNIDTIENRILSSFRSTKTKVRWYELDHEFLKSCHGQEKDYDFKKYIYISNIVSIRPYTTDAHLLDTKLFGFEIETNERTYAFGCESEQQKSNWLTALQCCWDKHVFAKGTFKVQSKELNISDIHIFEGNFKKQAQVYHSLTLEDRKFSVAASGVDLTNINDISKYLVNEALAAGNSSNLLKVLQLLLVIPPESDGLWEAIATGIQRLLMMNGGLTDIASADAAFADSSVTELLKIKAAEGGTAYAQMNKLALFAVNGEQEIEHLRDRISVLEETIQRLEENRIGTVGGTSSSLSRSTDTVVIGNRNLPLLPDLSSISNCATSGGEILFPFSLISNHLPFILDSTEAPAGSKYAKYEKMKKLLPEGAVRHKMVGDGLSAKEIDEFFSEKKTKVEVVQSQSVPGKPEALEDRLAKFERLQKLLTEAALLPPAPTTNNLLTVFDERLSRYEKMYKMLQDTSTVRRKMIAEGCIAAEVDKFFRIIQSSASGKEEEQASNNLIFHRVEMQNYFDNYFLQASKVLSSITGLVADFNTGPPDGMAEKPKIRPGTKMKPLFWNKIKSSDIPGTYW